MKKKRTLTFVMMCLTIISLFLCTGCDACTSQYDKDYKNAMQKWDSNKSTKGMTEGEKKAFNNYIDYYAKQLK